MPNNIQFLLWLELVIFIFLEGLLFRLTGPEIYVLYIFLKELEAGKKIAKWLQSDRQSKLKGVM